MTMDLSPRHLEWAASTVCGALEPHVHEQWSTIQAGELAWDLRLTIAHVCDAVGWYAAHLASQSTHRLPFDLRVHDDASNADLLDVLQAAAATLAQVARSAPPTARAYHSAGMADTSGFIAMGGDEILVHGWDALRGLQDDLHPPDALARPILRRLFPGAPTDTPAWPTLLWANGRIELPGKAERLGPDWTWHCAPLDEWHGPSLS